MSGISVCTCYQNSVLAAGSDSQSRRETESWLNKYCSIALPPWHG